ncbi:MAG: hypothetical protein HQ472_00540 [Ignavibacteria bacterium]|nr:hypothetical protein [Ignavibacteria bacterium]
MARRRNSVGILIGCVLTAVALWSYVTLTRQFEYDLSVPLVVTPPPNQALVSGVPDSITVRLRGSGLHILNLLFFSKASACSVNMQQLRNVGTTHIANFDDIVRSLETPQQIRVLSVQPNSLTMVTGDVFKKSVPVRLNSNITFREGFQLTHSLQPDPAYVEIRGTKSVVENISEWPTKRLSLADVHSSYTAVVDMSDSLLTTVYTVPSTIEIALDVQQTADATVLDIPVTLMSSLSGAMVSPSYISVVVRGGTDLLATLTARDIHASVNSVSASGIAQPTIELPPGLKVLRTEPQLVRIISKYKP